MLHQVSNPRATQGKYRNLTSSDWQAVHARISTTNGKATVTTANGHEVSFTRVEIEYLNQKYSKV